MNSWYCEVTWPLEVNPQWFRSREEANDRRGWRMLHNESVCICGWETLSALLDRFRGRSVAGEQLLGWKEIDWNSQFCVGHHVSDE
jgi:hypothetical protein